MHKNNVNYHDIGFLKKKNLNHYTFKMISGIWASRLFQMKLNLEVQLYPAVGTGYQ